MQLLPMDMPAEIRRLDGAPSRDGSDTVARGPLVIMAHGLLAIDPERRGDFLIRSSLGELDARQAAEVLRQWTVPQYQLA